MKIGRIQVQVRQYSDGRWGFEDYSSGKRHRVRCRTEQKALARATDAAVLLANGRNDLLQIDPIKLRQFLKWQSENEKSPLLADACAEFVSIKDVRSSRYYHSLESDLKLFEDFIGPARIGDVMAKDIQGFLASRDVGQRRKSNLRATIVSLFRWARRMSYLPDRTTEAEKVESIEKLPGQPNVLRPDEMRTLLDNVSERYLPWLCVAAFAGIRSEEIAPDYKSKKSPLRWEDFDWQHQVIIVRRETAKTKEEREVPILPNLAAWLEPYRNAKGPICLYRPSNNETGRLGALIGGWKHNALRDSFCSYRTRITQNVPQTSYEMGNSISMVKRSYHRRQPIETAREWFNIRPEETAENVVGFVGAGQKPA